jgi:hypothetical protein
MAVQYMPVYAELHMKWAVKKFPELWYDIVMVDHTTTLT